MSIFNAIDRVRIEETGAVRTALERIDLELFGLFVNHLSVLQGKVLVCGVGKSAIAARKIAATFATCTVPAVFIDPIGLYHGELGAINKQDTVLFISHSGETEELTRLIPHFQQRHCRIYAIVGTIESTIGRLGYAFETRVTHEAFARIPTASFAATVAIGDAIAVAVAQLKGEDEYSLADNHPGGVIGQGR